MKTIIAILLFLLIAIPETARACDTQDTASAVSSCIVLPFKTKRGVWFTLELADRLRYEHATYPTLQQQVEAYERLRGLYVERNVITDNLLKSKDVQIVNYQTMVDSLEAANRKLNESHWYDSRFFWFTLGVGSSILIVESIRVIGK